MSKHALDDHVRKHMALVSPHVRRRLQIAELVFNQDVKTKAVSDQKWVLRNLNSYFSATDQKLSPAILQKELDCLNKEIDLIKAAFAAGLGGREVMFKLCYEQAVTVSSANTASAPVYRLRPSDSAEFNSLAALFDEYTMTHATSAFRIALSANPPVAVLPGPHAAMAYDPVDNTAYGSSAGVLVAQQHTGPLSIGSYQSSPALSMTPTGFNYHHSHCPRGVQTIPLSTTVLYTGQWVDVTVTAADFGYHKYYVEAAGAAIISYTQEFTYYHTLWRSRS